MNTKLRILALFALICIVMSKTVTHHKVSSKIYDLSNEEKETILREKEELA
jgi:hypothetical protein